MGVHILNARNGARQPSTAADPHRPDAPPLPGCYLCASKNTGWEVTMRQLFAGDRWDGDRMPPQYWCEITLPGDENL